MRKYLIISLLLLLFLSIGFSQKYPINEIISERHPNGLKKLVNVFQGNGINETLIGKYGFYEDGIKHFVIKYKNNIKHGESTFWYENGQKKVEQTYKDGKENGLSTLWYENGQVSFSGTYKNGKWIYLRGFYRNGTEKTEPPDWE